LLYHCSCFPLLNCYLAGAHTRCSVYGQIGRMVSGHIPDRASTWSISFCGIFRR
jgi:hypothetical protein